MSSLTAPAAVANPRAEIVVTSADLVLGDRLAHLADGGDLDDYRPGWDAGDPPLARSIADEWEQRGYAIGRGGDLVDAAAAFPDAAASTLLRNRYWFSEGQHKGFAAFAKEQGYELGLAGELCDLPTGIPSRFKFDFQNGWHKGDMEADDRRAIMADWKQRLDWEREYEMDQREIDAINREAGGWDRAIQRSLV